MHGYFILLPVISKPLQALHLEFVSKGQIFNVVNTYNYVKIVEQSSTHFCHYENVRKAPYTQCALFLNIWPLVLICELF